MRFCRSRPAQCGALLLCTPLFLPCIPASGQQDARQAAHQQQALDKAKQLEDEHKFSYAIDAYKKADKLSGGKCIVCLSHLYQLYEQGGDNKNAATSAAQLQQLVSLPADKSSAALLEGAALLREATLRKKRELFQQADAQFKLALQLQPDAAQPLFLDGLALGRMGEDAAAKEAFARYVANKQADPIMQARARRYLADITLVRQNMAPAFSIRTLQGTILSLDSLQGRVVLLDFWATWNDASVKDLPHIQQIVQAFQGQPLVVLSVSLDGRGQVADLRREPRHDLAAVSRQRRPHGHHLRRPCAAAILHHRIQRRAQPRKPGDGCRPDRPLEKTGGAGPENGRTALLEFERWPVVF